jgi:hypothetical protein
MRIYALMLGVALTTGYGYAAQVAVSSIGAGHRPDPLPPGALAPDRGQVWYGGVLDPITVESERGPVAAKVRVFSRPTVRCPETAHSQFSAVS